MTKPRKPRKTKLQGQTAGQVKSQPPFEELHSLPKQKSSPWGIVAIVVIVLAAVAISYFYQG